MKRPYPSRRLRTGGADPEPVRGRVRVGCAGHEHDHDDGAATAPVIDPGDGGDYQPELDPADFVAVIDNPYLPLTVGSRWVYEGESEGEREDIEVVVTEPDAGRSRGSPPSWCATRCTSMASSWRTPTTGSRRTATGTSGTSARTRATSTRTATLVSKEGSWEYGQDGAQPGIVMPADPQPGDAYRQEFLAGEAEDMAEVLRIEPDHDIGLGTYEDVVVDRGLDAARA